MVRMPESDEPNTTNLPRFLDHLEARDRESAQLARQLLETGWTVENFLGPVQMDVWE